MKNPNVAFFLSFSLPGAGLAYLGRWKWAVVNFGVVLLIGLVLAFFMPHVFYSKAANYVAICCGGGSAGVAYALAEQMKITNGASQDGDQSARN